MRLRRALLLLGVLVLLFAIVKESREPFAWLFVEDLLVPKPDPHAARLSDTLSMRLYADPRPHIGKVARLQKGSILVRDGEELVEEGFGFGLPIIDVDGQAYLSRFATTERVDESLVKHYEMDTLDTPSGLLRRKYEPTASIGTVTVTYTVSARSINVTVDLSGLRTAWSRAYLMNEQGARTFTRYREQGLTVEGEQLGKWQMTTARLGCIEASDSSLQFCVETIAEATRYYGRERYLQYYPVGVYSLSWAGIDLELEPPLERYQYQVHIKKAGDG
jgi:hypothetical protein